MTGSVPFFNHGSKASTRGILRQEGKELVLEFRTIDYPGRVHHLHLGLSIYGRLPYQFRHRRPNASADDREAVTISRIPLNDVDALEFNGNFMFGRLRLRVRSMRYLSLFPRSNGAEINLYCSRRHKRLAQDLANSVTLQLLERVFADGDSLAGA